MEGKDDDFESTLTDINKHVTDLKKIDTQHATGLNALSSKVSSLYQSDNQMTSKLVNIFSVENQLFYRNKKLNILGKNGKQK